MNKWLKLFRVAVLLGVAVNLGFIIPALTEPDTLLTWLHLHPNQAAFPWMGNAAVLLIQISVFYVLIAIAPQKYAGFARAAYLLRLFVSLFWLHVSNAPGNAVFRQFFYTDLFFAVVQGVLLEIGLPAEARINVWKIGDQLTAAAKRYAQSRTAQVVTIVVLAFLGVTGYWLWANLARSSPDISFADPVDQFKYGAIGLSYSSRIPYDLFRVLPDVCPEKLPGGFVSVGLITEPGHDTPVGFSKRNIGFPSIEPNCALCHTSEYRTSTTGPAVLMLGAPAHTLDLQGFQRFLFACAKDPRFNVSNILSKIEKRTKLSFGRSLAYRLVILPLAKQGLLKQARDYAWQDSRPTQGKGRTDTFNPTKINVFHLPDDNTIGTVDFPATWNQRPKENLYLHWDSNNNKLTERNYAAAMAVGANAHSVIVPNFNRVTNFLLDLKPPAFPYPIDQAAAARGQAVWSANCASCHEFGTPLVGQVTPIDRVGTDPHRLDSFTQQLLDGFHAINDPPLVFDAYRKTNGYANMPLDGIWGRAPYLHNGSVPTLWDLLQAPDHRPQAFYTGYDLYDPTNVGFVSQGAGAAATGFRYDTTIPGNANTGHTYGTDLSDAEKRDLIEYMKKL